MQLHVEWGAPTLAGTSLLLWGKILHMHMHKLSVDGRVMVVGYYYFGDVLKSTGKLLSIILLISYHNYTNTIMCNPI